MRPGFIFRLFIPVVLGLALGACSVLAPPTPTATPVPTATPTATVEPTNCPFTQNPGPPPPEVVTRAQTAFAATGLPGQLSVNGFGEYSCSHFGLMEVDFEFSLEVKDLSDQAAMAVMVTQIKDIPQQALQDTAPLGNFRILFMAADHRCLWDDTTQTCS